MLKIRFQRFGKKKAPMYRISVLEKSCKRDGKPVEVLGFYNPKSKELVLNTERAKYWQSVGAQASDSVSSVLKREPIHDLVSGPYQHKAKDRTEKVKAKEEIVAQSTKNTKAKKKHAEAKVNAVKEAETAKAAEAEAKVKEAEAAKTAEAEAKAAPEEEKTKEAPAA
ncbi:MAG: 30S ribosomal protein S16 [Candidatus Melainabacteria bacterium]|nr:30S ribosomal protein S16 [Candidatus Melainabacteria bacterium]